MNWIYFVLFLFRYLFVTVSLGILFVNVKVFQSLKPWSRFTLGMSMSIVILPFITFLGALLWIGIPRIFLFLNPIVLSTGYLLYKKNYRVFILLVNEIKKYFPVKMYKEKSIIFGNVFFKSIVIFFSIIIFILLVQIFNARLHEDLYGSDEAHYIVQAKIFYENRNSWEIDHYKGKYEGTVFADDHGPLWPIYLVDSVLIKKIFNINAIEIKFSYILTIISMLVMIIDVGYIMSNNLWGGIFALFIYFLYHYAIYFPLNGSRDGFRIVALLGFLVFIHGLLVKIKKNEDVSWKEDCGLLLFSYFALNGHEGNIFVMLGISIIFFIIEVFLKLPFKQVFFSALSILSGTLLCFFKNIFHFVETGRFITTRIGAYYETKAAKLIVQDQNKLYGWKELLDTFNFSDILLLIIGIIAIVIHLIRIFDYDRNSNDNVKIYATSLLMGALLPMTGIFNFLGYNVSLYFFAQPRYRIYFLVIFALLGGMLFSEMQPEKKQFFAWSARTMIVLILCLGIQNLNKYYLRIPDEYRRKCVDFLKNTARIAESYATDGDIFVGEQIVAAYFDNPPKILYDYYAKPILIANDDDEIEKALDELNIQIILFNTLSDTYHYDALPFYQYLQTSENVISKQYEKDGMYANIYIVNDKIWK